MLASMFIMKGYGQFLFEVSENKGIFFIIDHSLSSIFGPLGDLVTHFLSKQLFPLSRRGWSFKLLCCHRDDSEESKCRVFLKDESTGQKRFGENIHGATGSMNIKETVCKVLERITPKH